MHPFEAQTVFPSRNCPWQYCEWGQNWNEICYAINTGSCARKWIQTWQEDNLGRHFNVDSNYYLYGKWRSGSTSMFNWNPGIPTYGEMLGLRLSIGLSCSTRYGSRTLPVFQGLVSELISITSYEEGYGHVCTYYWKGLEVLNELQ